MGTTVDDWLSIGYGGPGCLRATTRPSAGDCPRRVRRPPGCGGPTRGRDPDDRPGSSAAMSSSRGPATSAATWPGRLAGAGAVVAVADVDAGPGGSAGRRGRRDRRRPRRRRHVPVRRLRLPAPPARLIDADHAADVACQIVAGAANDVLAERRAAAVLADQGVTYVPDFLLNVGRGRAHPRSTGRLGRRSTGGGRAEDRWPCPRHPGARPVVRSAADRRRRRTGVGPARTVRRPPGLRSVG